MKKKDWWRFFFKWIIRFCCWWTLKCDKHAMMLQLSEQTTPKLTDVWIAAQFRAAALSFPSNLIVPPLPSDLWHFQHSSHLLLSHLPGSSPAAQVSCRLQPQLLSLSFSDTIKADKKRKRAAERKGKGEGRLQSFDMLKSELPDHVCEEHGDKAAQERLALFKVLTVKVTFL